jgi:E3 ubiquitin-protein ligase ATL10/75/76/77/78
MFTVSFRSYISPSDPHSVLRLREKHPLNKQQDLFTAHVNFSVLQLDKEMGVERMHARRLLSHATAAAAPSPWSVREQQVAEVRARAAAAPLNSLDETVITVLSLFLCALVIVLAVHSVVRCAFSVTRRACYGPEELPGGGGANAARERGPSSSCQAVPRRKGGARRALPVPLVYSRKVELAGCGASECAICLAEFAPGERVCALPHCNHGFHVKCIDRWLAARQTCPTCRRAPFAKPALPPA